MEGSEGGTGGGDGLRTAVFDPFAGVSGDMVLGAWVDLGLDPSWMDEVAEGLSLELEAIRVERVRRAGLSAPKVTVVPSPSGEGGHGHPFSELRRRIEESALSEETRSLSLAVFGRLAAAEARVHGVEIDRVHFHEVGAADALLDVCAAVEGYRRLGIERAETFPVTVGRGTVRIEHGSYPLPAPATALLLSGIEIRSPGYEGECVTPTGAALLRELTGGRPAGADFRVERVGYGAADRNPEDRPNCLRVWLGRTGERAEPLHLLQADLDDMRPEYLPDLVRACLEAGAVDAVVHTVLMKKGRPGWRIEALVEPAFRPEVEAALLEASSTLGLRSWPVARRVLPRSLERRRWRGHTIRVKRATVGSGGEVRAKAEHDDVAAAAVAEGLPAWRLLALLRREWPDLA